MKWITHQTGAALGALALGLPLPAIAASITGAIVPDVIDQKISGLAVTKKGRQKHFNRLHRGASHWFGWWLAAFLFSFTLPCPPLLRDVAIGFCLGILSHVLLDLLTPHGVPLTPFSQKLRIALPVCSTGKISEYLFLFAIIALGGIFLREALANAFLRLDTYL